MSDWNPAEIIGSRPKPLSLSLYKYLITDEVWALQRGQFGYQDVRPCKLVNLFSGPPYVNVKASLNSFIPADLSIKIKKKLDVGMHELPHRNRFIKYRRFIMLG